MPMRGVTWQTCIQIVLIFYLYISTKLDARKRSSSIWFSNIMIVHLTIRPTNGGYHFRHGSVNQIKAARPASHWITGRRIWPVTKQLHGGYLSGSTVSRRISAVGPKPLPIILMPPRICGRIMCSWPANGGSDHFEGEGEYFSIIWECHIQCRSQEPCLVANNDWNSNVMKCTLEAKYVMITSSIGVLQHNLIPFSVIHF